MRRKKDLRLHKIGAKPHKFKHTDFYYELVENTLTKPRPPLDIILTQFVEGLGEKGERISMKMNKAYNELLLPGLAVYSTPENIEKYSTVTKTAERTFSSRHVPVLLKTLSRCCLYVNMSIENPWVLERWHVRANFRKIGIIVTDDSITMPEKEIKGPNLDIQGKEFYVTITVNKSESQKVRCRLHHDSLDVTKQLPFVPDFWKIPAEPIFPEDKEVLDSLPRPKWEDNDIVAKS